MRVSSSIITKVYSKESLVGRNGAGAWERVEKLS